MSLPRTMEFPRLLSRIRRTRPIQCSVCVRQVHSKNKRNQYERRQTDKPREKPFDRRPFVNRRPVDQFLRAPYEPARQIDTQPPSTKPRFVNQIQEEPDRPSPYKGAKSPAAMERARRKADAMVRLWENGPPPPPHVERKIPKDVYVPVIVEEKEIVCINKPPNLLSQPGLPGEGTILDLLRFQRRDLQPLQTVNRYITWEGRTNYRLDKNTTGVMVLGRTPESVRRLNHMFQANKVEKNYLALLKPKPGSPLYTPDITACHALKLSTKANSILRGQVSRKTFLELSKLVIFQPPASANKLPTGYLASFDPTSLTASLTHFHVLARLDSQEKLLVQFTPLTGKKHQLRLHAAFLLGAPVIGDHRYGYPQDDGGMASVRKEDGVYKDGYALHCYRLAGDHKNIVFDVTATLPTGRWGDVWDDVRPIIEEEGFKERVKGISSDAKEVFTVKELQTFKEDPAMWSRGVKGQIHTQEHGE